MPNRTVFCAIVLCFMSFGAHAQSANDAQTYQTLAGQLQAQTQGSLDTQKSAFDLWSQGETYVACVKNSEAILLAEQGLATAQQMAKLERDNAKSDASEQTYISSATARIKEIKANYMDHCPNLPGRGDTGLGTATQRYDAAYSNFVELSNAAADYVSKGQAAFNAYDNRQGCGYMKGVTVYLNAAQDNANLMQQLATQAGYAQNEADSYVRDNRDYNNSIKQLRAQNCSSPELASMFIDPAQIKTQASNESYVNGLYDKAYEHIKYTNEAFNAALNYTQQSNPYMACTSAKSAYLNAGWALEDLRAIQTEAGQSGRTIPDWVYQYMADMQTIRDDTFAGLHDDQCRKYPNTQP